MTSTSSADRDAFAQHLRSLDSSNEAVARVLGWLIQATRMGSFGPEALPEVLHALRTGGGVGWNELNFDVEGDEVEVYFVRDSLWIPIEALLAPLEELAARLRREPASSAGDGRDLIAALGEYARAVVSGDADDAEEARRAIEQSAADPGTRAVWADSAARIIASATGSPGGIEAFAHALDRWATGDPDAGKALDLIVRRWETEFGSAVDQAGAEGKLRQRVRTSIRDAIALHGFRPRAQSGSVGAPEDSSSGEPDA